MRIIIVTYIGHTFGGEEFFLGGSLVVHAVEGEGELFSLILRARNAYKRGRLALFGARGVYDNVLVQLLWKQGTNSSNNPHRHTRQRVS